jgi:hypothetical protein
MTTKPHIRTYSAAIPEDVFELPFVDSLNSGFNRNLLQLACRIGNKNWSIKQMLRSKSKSDRLL